jgi:glycosyltransferase involved in cell wall biosynthesis
MSLAGRREPRVAIIHDWLQLPSGAERVLEQILACYPEADLYCVVDFLSPSQRAFLGGRVPRTSFIQRLPFSRRLFRQYVGLMPLAVEQFDLSGYDLVISSSHAVAKGVLTGPDTVHVSYVHSPMRYAHDLQHQYLQASGLDRGLRSVYARLLLAHLRRWDVASANRVDVFIANSEYIARRIRKAYRRDSVVIHPPVDTDRFTPPPADRPASRAAYVVASRQVAYKRIDLIAAAFAAMPQHRLRIIGDGPAHKAIRNAAAGAPNIAFVPSLPDAALVEELRNARAFVFAGEEDFGIVLAEALACGTPVVAFGRGGAAEIVTPATGLLFDEQTPEAIIAAIARFEALRESLCPAQCRAAAEPYAPALFRHRLQAAIRTALPAPR